MQKVIDALRECADENGPVIRRACRRDEVYSGPEVVNAPQVLVVPRQDVILHCAVADNHIVDVRPDLEKNGGHRDLGVFASFGPNLRGLGSLGELSVTDITPTILSYFGYDAPESMDGKGIPIVESDSSKSSFRGNLRGSIKALSLKMKNAKKN